MATEIQMPQITMTMIEGVITAWHKKKGDQIVEGEPLVDIETDKIVQTLNASTSGTLLEIIAAEGAVVPVGDPFCIIGDADSQNSASHPPQSASLPQPEPVKAVLASNVEKVVSLPKLTAQMKDAVIVRWLCREGDEIDLDAPLCDAEIDDTRRIIKAPEGGKISRFIVCSGSTVLPGDPLYALVLEGSDRSAPVSRNQAEICASPWAKQTASQSGMDLSCVIPTGPCGMIVESDVKKALLSQQIAPEPFAVSSDVLQTGEDDEIIPFIGIRKRIADHLMATKQTMADVTTFAEVNMGRIKAFRENLHISYNVFILKAASLALGDYPIMNSFIDGDKIIVKKSIGLCVAVATPRGLVTPVMRHAERLNLISIAEQLEDYAERGRHGMLTPSDFEGGTFTVTNSGTYGALFFTPIINSPQSAILGVGKIMMTPIVDENNAIVATPMMIACLSYDHRVVDGETAVKFLQRIKFYLEHPEQMTIIKKQ